MAPAVRRRPAARQPDAPQPLTGASRDLSTRPRPKRSPLAATLGALPSPAAQRVMVPPTPTMAPRAATCCSEAWRPSGWASPTSPATPPATTRPSAATPSPPGRRRPPRPETPWWSCPSRAASTGCRRSCPPWRRRCPTCARTSPLPPHAFSLTPRSGCIRRWPLCSPCGRPARWASCTTSARRVDPPRLRRHGGDGARRTHHVTADGLAGPGRRPASREHRAAGHAGRQPQRLAGPVRTDPRTTAWARSTASACPGR